MEGIRTTIRAAMLAVLVLTLASTAHAFEKWEYSNVGDSLGCIRYEQSAGVSVVLLEAEPYPHFFLNECVPGTGIRTDYQYGVFQNGTLGFYCYELELRCLMKDAVWLSWHRSNANGFNTVSSALGRTTIGGVDFYTDGDWQTAVAWLARQIGLYHERLANDPPDPNYQSTYEYPTRSLTRAWGLSAAGNDYVNRLLLALARVKDAQAGELVSNERAQGAAAALDRLAMDAQTAAGDRFEEDYQAFALEAAQLVAGLPSMLEAEGDVDTPFNAAALESGIDQLEATGVHSSLASLLIELTDDMSAPDDYLEFAQSLRGSSSTESVFSSMLLAAADLTVVDCDNGRDDDGDGAADLEDSDCDDAADGSEGVGCSDSVDNDGDGLIDLADPGCADGDGDEKAFGLACDDGRDNDGDGRSDYLAAGGGDPGCFDAWSVREDPKCQDGLNNDGQAGIDFDGGASLDIDGDGFIDSTFNPAMPAVGEPDAQCVGKPHRDKEAPNSGCGLGVELSLLFAGFAALRSRYAGSAA